MNINGNVRIKRRIIENNKGFTYKTTSSLAAYCPSSINMVPNNYVGIALSLCGQI